MGCAGRAPGAHVLAARDRAVDAPFALHPLLAEMMSKPPPGVVDRPYFSSWLLWTAEHHAELARSIEASRLAGRHYPFIEHRGLVLTAILASASFLEAMINELYQDVAEGYRHFGVTDPILEEVRSRMEAYWERTGGGRRGRLLEKVDEIADIDRSTRPYEDVRTLLDIRNALVHYRPNDGYTARQARRWEAQLKGRFEPNPIRSNVERAWWPEYALGSGCAVWAHMSARALADEIADRLGISPDYARHKAGSWFDQVPGETELCEEPG
jgi:hypothetical protein